MPRSGPAPKAAETRRRTNAATHDWSEYPDDPFDGGPELPEYTALGVAWLPAVRSWWAAVSSMPHAADWTASDWAFALATAEVAQSAYLSLATAAFAELRQREKILGATADARQALRIRYVRASLASVAELPQVATLQDIE
jgi:hypothetical protein